MNSVEYNKDLLVQADPLQLLQHIVCNNSDIMLKPGEKLLYSEKMKRKTVTNRVTGSKTTGNSGRVHLFKGVSISAGSSERKSIREDVTEYFNGTLYITSKRILFLSEQKGFEVPYTKISKLERNKESGNSVRIFEGQKFYEVVTDENNSVRITLIHRHIVSLINDGRISQL